MILFTNSRFLRSAGFVVLSALLGLQLAALATEPNYPAPNYHVIAKQILPGKSKWDYLTYDSKQRRLFISHADHVDVYDIVKKTIIGIIPDTTGVHGVALATQLDRGFTSNGKANNVTVFRLSDLTVLATVATAKNPDAIVYDSASNHVFTANGGSDSLSVIDANNNRKLGSIALHGKPEFAVVDGKGQLFVNAEDKNQLLVVDTHRQVLTKRYDLAPACNEPTGLALDRSQQRLFVGCHNKKLLVVNANNGALMQSLPIDAGNDAVVYDPDTKLIFSSNGAGTLTVIGAVDANHYQVKQIVTTIPSARTMALNPDSGEIYLVGAEARLADSGDQTLLQPNAFVLVTVAP